MLKILKQVNLNNLNRHINNKHVHSVKEFKNIDSKTHFAYL